MLNRRQFVQTSSIAAAGIAMAQQASAAQCLPGSDCKTPFILDSDLETHMADFLSGGGLDVSWAKIHGPLHWSADNVQMHLRYTPADGGARLTGLDPLLSSLRSSGAMVNKSLFAMPGAVAINVRPYAILVNVEKADRKGIAHLDLASFAKRDVRPVFPLNMDGFAPENSWLLPMLHAGGVIHDRFLETGYQIDTHDAAALGDLMQQKLSRISVDYNFAAPGEIDYAGLINGENDRIVALYGDPIALTQKLSELGSEARLGREYAAISLQKFLGTSSPSLFPAQMLQIGQSAPKAGVDKVVAGVLERVASLPDFEIATAGMSINPSAAETDFGWNELRNTHDMNVYHSNADLPTLTDGGVLGSIILNAQENMILIGDDDTASFKLAAATALHEGRALLMQRRQLQGRCA